jgi:hypothetical protein
LKYIDKRAQLNSGQRTALTRHPGQAAERRDPGSTVEIEGKVLLRK